MKFFKGLPTKKRITLLVCLILSLILGSIGLFLLKGAKEIEAGWWNETWTYRKRITLTNPSNTVENAQIKVFDGEDLSALVTAGKLQSALEDLRFTDYSGNLLQYYIEDDTNSAVEVWILIPSLIEGESTIFMYYGNSSATSASNSKWMADLGGTISYLGEYRIHAFLNTGSDTYVSYAGREVEALVVAGGGGGGAVSGGGGGAGGLILESTHSLSTGVDVGVTVGAGGIGGIDQYTKGTNGENSLFDTVESIGGGGGGSISNRDGGDGGSGGGANSRPSSPGGIALLSGAQGNKGGDGVGANTASSGSGAGGGGFSEPGDDTPDEWHAGDGGDGTYYGSLYSDSYGETGYFAGGGGGGYSNYSTNPGGYAGVGGNGGGGDGKTGLINGDNGLTNTGGGGGGGGYNGSSWTGGNGGSGGSGIVLVRYESDVNTPTDITIGSVSTTEEISPAPIAYWKFDEGTGVVANDSSGKGNDGTITGATWETEDMCVSGKCLSFDGTDDYVTLSNPGFSNDSEITITGWAKGDFQKRSGLVFAGATGGQIFGVQDGKLHAYITTSTVQTDAILEDNTWYFLAITFDGTTFRQYVNGVEENSANVGYVTGSGSSWRIGESTASDRRFPGHIDEVKIYPYARTEEQIKSDYAAGLSGIGSTKGASTSFGSYSPKWMSDGLVGYWKMDESSWNGTTGEVIDHSGNSNHGTSVNGTTPSTGKFGNGGSFDGTDDYISSPTKPNLNQDATLSFWVNKTTSGGDGAVVAGMWDYYGGVVLRDGGRAIIAGGGYAGRSGTSLGAFPEGQYTHIVITWEDLLPTSFWVDGEEVAIGSSSSWTAAVDTGLYIGARMLSSESVPSLYFNGSIDEVRIYNRALSPTEIKDLYEWAPGPIAHYTFDDSSNTTNVVDISGYGNTGTWYGSSTNRYDTGTYGNAGVFNGSDDYVSSSGNNTNFISEDFTLSFWAKAGVGQGENKRVLAQGTFQVDGWEVFNSNGRVTFRTNQSGAHQSSTADYTDDGKWHHIEIVRRGSSTDLYIDGKLENSGTGHIDPIFSDDSLEIGTNTDYSSYSYNGLIDDIRIYNYARTQKQILEDMGGSIPGSIGMPKPISHWKFDEGSGTTASDSIGNNDGTITGASWTQEGRKGNALSFDGTTSNYVNVPAITSLTTGSPFTLVSWVKPESTSSYRTIMGYSGTNRLLIASTGTMLSQQDGNFYSNSSAVPNGQWSHVVYWFNGTEERWYINGKQSGSAHNTTSAEWENSFYIGQYDLVNYPYKGLIDEVKIYNTALTPEEVLLDYNQGMTAVLSGSSPTVGNIWGGSASSEYCIPGDTSTCNPPVGEWLFDDNQGSTAKDTSGNNNNGTLVNSPSWSKGKEGTSALSFDGSDDYVGITNAPYSQAKTVTGWIKPEATQPGGTYIRVLQRSNNSDRGFRILLYNNRLEWWDANGNSDSPRANSDHPPDEWLFFAGRTSENGNTYELYINGVLQTETRSVSPAGSGTDLLDIGRTVGDSSNYFNGIIDDIRIYDYARTPAQIAWDYNRGAPIGHWRLDECQGTTVHDISGNNNDGTINIGSTGTQTSAGTCTSDNTAHAWYNGREGKINSSLNFDGTDDYVGLSDPQSISGLPQISVSAWIHPKTQGVWRGIIGSEGSGAYHFQLQDGNRLEFYLYGVGDGVLSTTYFSSSNLDRWHHVVGVYNGSTVKLYVNGIEEASKSGLSGDVSTSNDIKIGRSYSVSRTFNGLIDDVRIYNYALTENQIKLLYNNNSSVRF